MEGVNLITALKKHRESNTDEVTYDFSKADLIKTIEELRAEGQPEEVIEAYTKEIATRMQSNIPLTLSDKAPKKEKNITFDISKELNEIKSMDILEQEPELKKLSKKYKITLETLKTKLKEQKEKSEEEAETTSVRKEKMESNQVKYLLEQGKPEFKSLGVGLHEIEGEQQFYFGSKVYNGVYGMDAIITGDKKIYLNSYNPETQQGENQISRLGLNIRYPFMESVLDYTWSNNETPYSIKEYIFGEPKNPTLRECYEDTYKNNVSYMDYSEDIIHTSIACDILSSFFLPIFEAKGRAFFNAEKGSGKTRQSMLYDLQMFNPIMSADMSGASYYRVIESTSASIIIDDFDAIEEEKKQAQIQVMRTGYKKGQKAVRCSDTGNKAPQTFSVFNSMIINNVGGLDDITQDRCNTYYLIKTNNKEKADRKFNEKDISWKVQRDKKFYSAMLNWKKVKQTYETLQVDGVSGRDLERVAPILTIGKLVLSEKEYNELVTYELKKISDNKTRDVSDDWVFLALQYILKVMIAERGETKVLSLLLNDIVKNVIQLNPEDRNYQKTKQTITAYLSKVFRNTPLFKAGKVHGGFVKYTFEPLAVLKFIEIRNYTDYFDEVVLTKFKQQNLTQSIHPIQSIQSNQSNQSIQQDNNIKNVESGETGESGERQNGTILDNIDPIPNLYNLSSPKEEVDFEQLNLKELENE